MEGTTGCCAQERRLRCCYTLLNILSPSTNLRLPAVYSLSTIEVTESGNPIPRTRTVVHRAFMSPLSESIILLQITTDIRTPKADQILSRPESIGVAWWLPKSNLQYRLTCTGYLLPHPSHPSWTQFPAWKLGPNVEWEHERLKAYDALPGDLRASFCRPVPGSTLENPEDAKKWPRELPKRAEAADDTERQQVDEALKNFAILLLEPREVDVLELAPVPKLRTKYVKVDGCWTEESLVP